MSIQSWVKGRLIDEGRGWPTIRLCQGLVDLVAPNYDLRERVLLISLIAHAQGLDTCPDQIAIPNRYLQTVTGAHDRAWIREGLEKLASQQVLCNATNSDRAIGKQVRTRLIRWRAEAPDSFAFDPTLAEHILHPRQYAYVEMAVVVALRSRYAVALYPILCAEAGRALWSPWEKEFDVRWLLKVLDHPGPYALFARDALTPALNELSKGTQARFWLPNGAKLEAIRGAGRGRRTVAVKIRLGIRPDAIRSLAKVRPEIRRRMLAVPRTSPKPHIATDPEDTFTPDEVKELLFALDAALQPLPDVTATWKACVRPADPHALRLLEPRAECEDPDEAEDLEDGWYFDEVVDTWRG